jgi:hypothetical protein
LVSKISRRQAILQKSGAFGIWAAQPGPKSALQVKPAFTAIGADGQLAPRADLLIADPTTVLRDDQYETRSAMRPFRFAFTGSSDRFVELCQCS